MPHLKNLAALAAVVAVLVIVVIVLFVRAHGKQKDQYKSRPFGRHRTHANEPDDYYAWFDRPRPLDYPWVVPEPSEAVTPEPSWCWCECPQGGVTREPRFSPDGTGRLCRCPCV